MKFDITLEDIERLEDLMHYIQLVESGCTSHKLGKHPKVVAEFLNAIGAALFMAKNDRSIGAITGALSVDSRDFPHETTSVFYGNSLEEDEGAVDRLIIERGKMMYLNFDHRLRIFVKNESSVFGWVMINHNLERVVWAFPKKG